MKWLYRHLHKKEKGFTLVELMVVIIILAVLTGIAIPSYLALRNRARNQAARAEMKNIATALEMYAADYEVYPLTAAYPAALSGTNPDSNVYMDPVPTTDPWGVVAYAYLSAGDTYTLTCTGADPDIVMANGQFQ